MTLIACHHRGDKIDHVASKIEKKMELTDAQKAPFNDLVSAIKEIRNDAKANRGEHFKDLKALISSEKITAEQLNEKVVKRQEKMTLAKDKVIPKLVTFFNTLDQSQKQELLEIVEKFEKRMK